MRTTVNLNLQIVVEHDPDLPVELVERFAAFCASRSYTPNDPDLFAFAQMTRGSSELAPISAHALDLLADSDYEQASADVVKGAAR